MEQESLNKSIVGISSGLGQANFISSISGDETRPFPEQGGQMAAQKIDLANE